jgi:hypothetical protein
MYAANKWNGKKTLCIENIHKFIFSALYVPRLDLSEETSSYLAFELSTIDRIKSVLKSPLIKVSGKKDINMITPYSVVTVDISPKENDNIHLSKGTICFPLIVNDSFTKVLVPCGGPDPETDKVPDYFDKIKINEIVDFPKEQYPIISGSGICSEITKSDNFCIVPNQDIRENDILVLKGESRRIKAVSVSFNRDSSSAIRIYGEFNQSHKRQPFKIQRCPSIMGILIELPTESLITMKKPVIKQVLKSGEKIGIVVIEYYNSCFNGMGYLCHDTHYLT